MRRVAWAAAMAVSGLCASTVIYAATITESDTTVRFAAGCNGAGFYTLWNRSLIPDQDEFLFGSTPEPVNWSATSPIDVRTGSPAIPGQDLVFLLFDEDMTLVFDAQYQLIEGSDGVPYFRLDVSVDCSVVPYRITDLPDTSLNAGGPGEESLAPLLTLAAAAVAALLMFLTGSVKWSRPH